MASFISDPAVTRMDNLAMMFYNQGKWEAAEEIYRRVLGLYEKMLGTRTH
jgi:Tetratricopeptide repeat